MRPSGSSRIARSIPARVARSVRSRPADAAMPSTPRATFVLTVHPLDAAAIREPHYTRPKRLMEKRRTALAALARSVLEAAVAIGMDVDDVLRTVRIDRADIDDEDGRVEVGALLRLWELVAEA